MIKNTMERKTNTIMKSGSTEKQQRTRTLKKYQSNRAKDGKLITIKELDDDSDQNN